MTVLSVDLASRRYRDIGVAVLRDDSNSVQVEILRLAEHGLDGTPDAKELALFCARIALDVKAKLILMDGPQGWRSDFSNIEHMRLCERLTHAPGKTGLPGIVKPAPWRRMAEFSVAVFDALDDLGWPRLSDAAPPYHATVEAFPTHAWRALGYHPLPAKSRRNVVIDAWVEYLSILLNVKWDRFPNHDELQAVVAGIGGINLIRHGLDACELYGEAPRIESGVWREGYILSPKPVPAGGHIMR